MNTEMNRNPNALRVMSPILFSGPDVVTKHLATHELGNVRAPSRVRPPFANPHEGL